MAHMLWHPDVPAEAKTLRAVRAGLTVPQQELRDTLEGVYLTSESQLARDLAGPLFQMVPETFDGIVSNAQEATAWLSVASYASMVSGGDYSPAELCNGRTTVFCQIPMKALEETPEVARVVVGSHLGSVFEAGGEVDGRVLFLLDEAVLLGPMKALSTARDQGRKYRITLQLFYQSEGQAIDVWGRDGWRAWCDAVTWRMYGAVSDLQTAKDLSATIGAFGAVAKSRGSSRGRQARFGEMQSVSRGSSTNEHEVSRPLMHPFELMRMRGDARLVLYRGELPIYCTAAFGYMRPDLRGRLGQNRYRRAYPHPALRRVG
jgi:type IV secretion system protein VirD4